MKLLCGLLCVWVTFSVHAMDYVVYKEKERTAIKTMSSLSSAVSILGHQLRLLLYATERIAFHQGQEMHDFANELPPATIGTPFCIYNFKTPTVEKGTCCQHEDDVSKIAIMEHVVQHIFDLLYDFDTEKLKMTVLQSLKTINIILGQFSGKVSSNREDTIVNTARLREKLLNIQEALLPIVEPFEPPVKNPHGEKQYCSAIYTALAKKHFKRDDVDDKDLRRTLELYDTVRLQP